MMGESERHATGRIVRLGVVALLILAGVVIAVSAVVFALRGSSGAYPYYGFFPFGFGWIFGLFFLFFLFWGIRWWAWGGGWGRRWRYGPWGAWGYGGYGDSAHAILRERYARGEITKDQFEQMMQDLERHS